MGSSNIMRLMNEALRQGEFFPLTSGQKLKFLPSTDNVGAINIGDGTTDMDLKIFMGTTSNYVEWDISVPQVNIAAVPHVFTSSDITMLTSTLKLTSCDLQYQGAVGLVSGAIAIKSGIVMLTKAGVAAMTLANPTATTDDNKRLLIVAATANAHTVTQTAPGFNNAGAAGDVATFGGAVGDCMELVAYQGVWHVVSLRNVTLA